MRLTSITVHDFDGWNAALVVEPTVTIAVGSHAA